MRIPDNAKTNQKNNVRKEYELCTKTNVFQKGVVNGLRR